MTAEEKYKALAEHIFEQKLYEMLWHPVTDEAKLKKSAEMSLLNDLVNFIETIEEKADIADAPTEDVEPVKRGKWEWENGGSYDSSGKRCSICGTLKDSVYSNYCPNCGARMEE